MTDRRDVVLRAPLVRAICSLSWPIIASNLLGTLAIAVMLFWLGRIAGEQGLVVESLYRPFGHLIAWVFASTAIGTSVLVSRSVGASDGKALSISAAGATVTFWMSVGLVAIALPLSPYLARLLSGDAPVQGPMLHFLLGALLVWLPAATVSWVVGEMANATGDTRFTLLRIVVDLVFMAGIMPLLMLAGLGIAGAPVAEGLGGIGLIVVVWTALARRRKDLHLGELERGAFGFRWRLWREVLGIGLPLQLGRIAMYVIEIILVRLVTRDGDAAVAGFGIASALVLFGGMATMGVAQGGGILIGQALGAGLYDRARRSVGVLLVAGMLIMGVFVGATLFDRPVIGLFSSDPHVVAAGVHALAILRWGLFGAATWQILLDVFAAYKTTVRAGLLMVAGELLGLVFVLVWSGSLLDRVCYAFIVSNALKAVLMLWLLARTGTVVRPRAQ